jgi:hypothetical protein
MGTIVEKSGTAFGKNTTLRILNFPPCFLCLVQHPLKTMIDYLIVAFVGEVCMFKPLTFKINVTLSLFHKIKIYGSYVDSVQKKQNANYANQANNAKLLKNSLHSRHSR